MNTLFSFSNMSYNLRDYNNPNYQQEAKRFEDEILNGKDINAGYLFAVGVLNYDCSKIENMIIDFYNSKNFRVESDYDFGRVAFLYVKNVKNHKRAKELEEIVWKSKDIELITQFGRDVKGVDLNRYENLIIESKIPKLAYTWLRSGKCQNPIAFKAIIVKSKKPRYLFELAKHLPLDEKQKIEDLIIAAKSDMYVRLYAKHIDGANVKRLENRIIETKSVHQIRKFGKTIKGSRCEKLGIMF
jgi:hypothetical protein